MAMRKVVRNRDLPTRPPVLLAAVVWLYMDRFGAPGWLHGVVWTFVGLLMVSVLVTMVRDEEHWPVKFRDKEPGE